MRTWLCIIVPGLDDRLDASLVIVFRQCWRVAVRLMQLEGRRSRHEMLNAEFHMLNGFDDRATCPETGVMILGFEHLPQIVARRPRWSIMDMEGGPGPNARGLHPVRCCQLGTEENGSSMSVFE